MADQIARSECTMPDDVENTRTRKRFMPDADIYETNETVVVVADVPGVAADGIDVTLEKNVLTIRGTVSDEAPEGFTLGYAEYETGDYQRSFSISDEIEGDRIEAAFGDGVLTLTLPKASSSRKKIAVSIN